MGHRGRHIILAQALHRFIDYSALYLEIEINKMKSKFKIYFDF